MCEGSPRVEPCQLGPDPEVQAALSAFLDWVETPPGWPVRCLLAECRKNKSKEYDPKYVNTTASSRGVLPWAFGHPIPKPDSLRLSAP